MKIYTPHTANTVKPIEVESDIDMNYYNYHGNLEGGGVRVGGLPARSLEEAKSFLLQRNPRLRELRVWESPKLEYANV